MAIEKSIGGTDQTRELVVEEAARVIEPLGIGALGVGNPVGKVGAGGDVQHVQERILAAVFGEAIDDARAVRRGPPPVQRYVPGGAAQRGRIDQRPIGAGLANEELEIVRAAGPLLEEELAAGPLHPAGEGDVAGELPDAPREGLAAWDRVEDGAGMSVLRRQKRQPVRVLVVLHPPVGVAERLAEVGVLNDGDLGDRRRRNRRAGEPGGEASGQNPSPGGQKSPAIQLEHGPLPL